MKRNLITSILMTIVATILLGIIYPFVVTALAQGLFREKANGQLISRDGKIVGSRIIGQTFVSEAYFHSRPSAAGNGYDAANSGASNLGPTNHALIDRVNVSVIQYKTENPSQPVPIDLVTTSGSGLDPHITPAGAGFQIPRLAKVRGISEDELRSLIAKHTDGRQFGFLGEPRVNVLELNLDLDSAAPQKSPSK
ncbi:MAG TPA: potassium-transporting ATPase subunit KdpC [Terriglobales bacterium]|nr:potassium-transporting ATPase subunit KdpC [Terriglobales bacterium]